MRKLVWLRAGAFMCVVGAAQNVRAGGLELPDNGGIALGRAGAFTARASDPLALAFNVAGIVGLPGVQITLGSNFGFLDHCFAHSGTYDSSLDTLVNRDNTPFAMSEYDAGGIPYARACRNALMTATPHLMATWRPYRTFAIGLGFYAPTAAGSSSYFPDRETLTYMGRSYIVPSPVRHMLYEKSLLLGHPTIALAWEPIPGMRIGAAIQPSFAFFRYTTMINTVADGAQSPDTDLQLALAASGMFLAGNFGMQLLPSPYLSFGLQVHLNSTLDLQGQATATPEYYVNPRPGAPPRATSTFPVTHMVAPLPHSLRAGVRFALPRPGHPTQVDRNPSRAYDPMNDDVFDLEVDGFFENTRQMSQTYIGTCDTVMGVERCMGTINIGGGTNLPAPRRIESSANMRDVWGVRVGSDVNVVPGVLALRAGVAYETGAQSPETAVIHLASFNTLSIHGGFSVRWRWFTLSAAYAHYFFEDLDASTTGTRAITGPMGLLDADNCVVGRAGPQACQINRGRFSGSHNIVGASLTARF